MYYDFINNIESCYVEVPGLLYYSHIPTSIIVLFFAIYFFIKNKNNKLISYIFLHIATIFFVWNLLNLIIWHSYNSVLIMTLWSIFGLMYVLIHALCLYFLYVFIYEKDISKRIKVFLIFLLSPIIILTPTKYNLSGFDMENCQPFENIIFNSYQYFLGMFLILWIIGLILYTVHKVKNKKRVQILLVGSGILLFLISFSWAEILGSYTEDFVFTQYGLFGAPVFVGFLVYVISKFNAFNIKLLSAQSLVFSLAILNFSLIFINDVYILHVIAIITFILISIFGYFLIRSVKKEIALREQLEIANKQQNNLLHFISHQVKGFFTKSRNVFSGLLEGDYGPIPETARHVIQDGFDSDNRGVQTVQEILSAANFRTGQTTYSMSDTNIINVIKDILLLLKPSLDRKNIALNFNPPVQSLIINADTAQITQAFKNLIDNSIKYTPSGKIDINLDNSASDKITIKIQDTGVGITAEDMKNLFKEGGRGKESLKINVDSTGYGLYIVKNIIEAHGGSVTPFSEGPGKGTTFTVILPVK